MQLMSIVSGYFFEGVKIFIQFITSDHFNEEMNRQLVLTIVTSTYLQIQRDLHG